MMKRILAALVLLALAGCTPYQLIPPGKVDFGGKVEVETDIAWNGRASEEGHTWTMDGPALQSVIFHLGVEDGETLFEAVDLEATHNPLLALAGKRPDEVSYRFRKTMTEPELMDLFAASFAALNKIPVEATNLTPASLGGKPGFRFDYHLAGADGVRRKGMVIGAVVKDELYMVNYLGTALYHFDKHRDDVERMVATLRFTKAD